MTPEPADAVLFPYLWIRDRISVGPREIVPRGVLADDDFARRRCSARGESSELVADLVAGARVVDATNTLGAEGARLAPAGGRRAGA